MVRKEGQENGLGVWEVDGYEKLEQRIRNAVERGIEKQEKVDSSKLSVQRILIVGSFGSGLGVPGKSDLDIVVGVGYRGDVRNNKYSTAMKHIAGEVNTSTGEILRGFDVFDGLETYVYPPLEIDKHLAEMAKHEPVETYYDLENDRKWSYF